MERRNFLKQAIITAAGGVLLPQATLGRSIWEEQPPLLIDAKGQGRAFTHFWNKCVGAGRGTDGFRQAWFEQLQFTKKYCGFQYYRLHSIFRDDMATGTGYNWQYMDDLLDRMVKSGVKPFLSLGFGKAPVDAAKWGDLVGNFTKHAIERFGAGEVNTWYFEILNEPNLQGNGKTQYFALYKNAVKAIKAVSPQIRTGGPATGSFVADGRFDGETEDKGKQLPESTGDNDSLKWKGVWIEDFLEYCKQEQLPVDFVSAHPYPTDFTANKNKGRTRSAEATLKDLQWLKQVVAQSAFPKAEIHLTEWGSSPATKDDMRDNTPAAAFIVKANIDSVGLVDSMAYRAFTDSVEETGASSAFYGGPGLLNYQGIPKPAFHAYRMLSMLGDELIHNKDGIIVTRHRATQKVTAIIYNYPTALTTAPPAGGTDVVGNVLKMGEAKEITFKITNATKDARFNVEILDKDDGNALAAWKQSGNPEAPSAEQAKNLQQMALAVREEQVLSSNTGVLLISKILQPWDVVLIDEIPH
ncbi:MAG TPA: hypothetical protein VJ720_03340 [Chitinophaga sp.]|nr:hypothetical protein [Chitinophaga sp.]